MHEVWMALGLRYLRVEQLSILRKEVDMRQEIVVPGKYRMSALMLALKGAEINAEAIPVHMHQGHTETKNLKDNNGAPTVLVHSGSINETTTLPLSTEAEWSQAASEDHYLRYIQRILSSPEKTAIDPK